MLIKTNPPADQSTSGIRPTGARSDPQHDFCVVGKGIKQQIEDTGDSRGSGGFRLRASMCADVILQWNTQKGWKKGKDSLCIPGGRHGWEKGDVTYLMFVQYKPLKNQGARFFLKNTPAGFCIHPLPLHWWTWPPTTILFSISKPQIFQVRLENFFRKLHTCW